MKFQVTVGIVTFRAVEASCPREAIEAVKAKIDRRRHGRKDPHIGMSLVEALDSGKLTFLVFDADRKIPLAGEHAGIYQEPPLPEVARVMHRQLTPAQLGYIMNQR